MSSPGSTCVSMDSWEILCKTEMLTSEISSHHDLRKKHTELTWADDIFKHFICSRVNT